MFGTIDLYCARYQIKAGSIRHGDGGYVFRCTISPVEEDVVSSLAEAARMGATIRLVFPEQPLLLERVEIVRVDAACVRIVGHVVDGGTKRLLVP
jgi:hypothetical protein